MLRQPAAPATQSFRDAAGERSALQVIRSLPAFQDAEWMRLFGLALIVSFALHLAAATFSVGYYHTDEHFQILEFLNYKLGRAPSSALAIEFGWKMRPWLQPAIDYVFARAMSAVGITSPFSWVWFFRFVSAFLGWLSLAGLSLLSYNWFSEARLRKLALLLVATLWYLPALHARHSSESLSGSVFYIGASLLFLLGAQASAIASFCIGILFGAAFEFRYQVAFLVIGAVGYFLFVLKPKFSRIVWISAGVLAMIAIGTWIDRWGYGTWTLTPWNYFRYNIVLNHVSDVDTQPVWDFFRSSLTETFPPLGFIALVSFTTGWIFRPLHVLTWITFPLFLVHSLIGHKELRFIFPLAGAGPFLILLALTAENRAGQALRRICFSRGGALVASGILGLNLIALVGTTFLPCWMPARLFSQLYELRERLPPTPLQIFYVDKNPFEILGIPMTYYRPPVTESVQLSSMQELAEKVQASSGPVWFFKIGYDLNIPDCRPVMESLPGWIAAAIRWEPLRPFTHRVTDWVIYRCDRTAGAGSAAGAFFENVKSGQSKIGRSSSTLFQKSRWG